MKQFGNGAFESLLRRSWFLILVAFTPASYGTIVVNGAMTIDSQVTVQLIQAREDDGSNAATVFGNSTQQDSIEDALDSIWAQAGIDINVLVSVFTYDNSFALDNNNNTAGTRPTAHLDTIFNNAASAGVLNTGNVINIIFVDFVPGFTLLSENSTAGLAYVDDSGITMFAGVNLLSFQNGRDVIASVAAHEIGHNLGLDHTANGISNLMSPGGDTEQLDAGQIAIARASDLVIAIPEPASALLFGSVLLISLAQRRRKQSQLLRKIPT